MKFNWYAFKLAGVCIAVFLLQLTIPAFTDWFLLDANAWSEPWRFVTSIFLHGGIGHIAYNMFALLLFGSILERLVGGRKFLLVFFMTGIIANMFSVLFYPSSLGASGAIFGVIGALIVIRPTLVVWAFGLPMPLFIAGIIWAVGDIIGAIGFFIGNPIDSTGNLAHLSGMVIGLALGALFRERSEPRPRAQKIVLDERMMRDWEDRHL